MLSWSPPRAAPLLILLLAAGSHGGDPPDVDAAASSGMSSPADAAVVIGVEDYAFLEHAPYAERDARGFHSWLVYGRGVPADRITLLASGASKEAIEAALDKAGQQAGEGATAWIYFAGHAVADSGGDAHLLGDDARAELSGALERGVSLADAARRAGAGGAEVAVVADTNLSGLGRGGAPLFPDDSPGAPSLALDGVTWLGDAGAAGPAVFHPVEHGAFTYLLLGALRGWADGAGGSAADGQVTAGEARRWVEETLAAAGLGNQRPSFSGDEGAALTRGSLEAEPEKLGELARLLRLAPGQSASVVAPSQDALNVERSLAWSVVEKTVVSGTPYEKRTVLQQFIDRYEAAAWLEGGRVVMASVPEVDPAGALRSVLLGAPTAAASSMDERQVGFGLHAGAQTGLRVEWRLGGKVDSAGVRAGLSVPISDGAYLYSGYVYSGAAGPQAFGELVPYLDIGLTERWQLEVGAGLLIGSAIAPTVDVAAQLDPPDSRFQLNAGLGVGKGAGVLIVPRLDAGLVW